MSLKSILPKALLFLVPIFFSYVLICFYLSTSTIQKVDSDDVYRSIVTGIIGEDVDLKFPSPISLDLILIKQDPLDSHSLYMMPLVIDSSGKNSLRIMNTRVADLNIFGLYIKNFNG